MSVSDVEDMTPSPDHDVEFEMKQKGPKHFECQEDDDFLAAFDKMLMDNIQQRSQEVVKVAQVSYASEFGKFLIDQQEKLRPSISICINKISDQGVCP